MKFRDMFHFDKFMMPVLVKIIYWSGLFILTFSAILGFLIIYTPYGDRITIISIALLWLFSCLLWRIFCEATVLLFKIYSRLTEIRDRLPTKSGS